MKAYLILSDGSVYEGESIGKQGSSVGEAVFTTSMGGYMEALTDPSYLGQMIVQTFPLIGNYGAILADCESKKSFVAGYVVKELCDNGSNFRKESELEDFLIEQSVVGIKGVDTRAITKKLREAPMNSMITDSLSDLEDKLKKIRAYKVTDALKQISPKIVRESGKGRTIVLYDFGSKMSIENALIKRGCRVISVPYNTTAEEALKFEPDGILLSNGGGNPDENKEVIAQTAKLLKAKIPMFGICLGHQIMCLASGAKTKKLRYGHRGGNQPVKDLGNGRVFITSQNHGYSVVASSLDASLARITMVNANDKTCEGVEFLNTPAFSVQFHPEASSGPHDTMFLFDQFVANADKYASIRGKKNA